jgi:ABC-type phosphate/phosphonate transport system permease subunit
MFAIPMLEIRDKTMLFWFVVWVMAIFNLALYSKNKTKTLMFTAALVFVPFLAAHSINSLIGDTTNLYNITYEHHDYWGDLCCTYTCGYIYMCLAIPISIYLSLFQEKRKSVTPVLEGSLKDKFKDWLDS